MRKKLVFFIVLAFFFGSTQVFSQNQGGGGGLSGLSAEMNFDLFTVDELSIMPSMLKVRYFINDDIAVRVSTWFDLESDQKSPESTLNYTYFAARPGVEYHLVATKEARAYAGLEVILDRATHDFDTKVGVPVTGAWDVTDIRNFENRGYLSYGAALVVGAEIYKGGSFFVGTELGFAYTTTTHSAVEYGEDLFLDESKTTSFKLDLSRMLRVGFTIN
ncbi:MAG: hypothetical protein PF489_01545 [Salinivirgaceae bacterium]|jgi:hypothetical protein|nr:hypothetical protein [Salinivirgaceae bacterium]